MYMYLYVYMYMNTRRGQIKALDVSINLSDITNLLRRAKSGSLEIEQAEFELQYRRSIIKSRELYICTCVQASLKHFRKKWRFPDQPVPCSDSRTLQIAFSNFFQTSFVSHFCAPPPPRGCLCNSHRLPDVGSSF